MKSPQELLNCDHFARHVGIELVEVAPGRAKATLGIRHHHLNGFNIVQGGVIFTLADYAFAAASNSHGLIALAVNASIAFIKAADHGTLTAVAEEVSVSSKLGTYRVTVFDEESQPVAIFQGTVYRKHAKGE